MQATLFSSWCREAKISFWKHSGCTMSHRHKCVLLCRLKAEEMTTLYDCERCNCSCATGFLCLRVSTLHLCSTDARHPLWRGKTCAVFFGVKLLSSPSLCARLRWRRYHRFCRRGYTKEPTGAQRRLGCWQTHNNDSSSSSSSAHLLPAHHATP